MSEKIQISFLENYPSLLEGIFSLTGISKNQIKKYLSKKKQNISVRSKEHYSIPIDILNYGRINPIYSGQDIKILAEDDHFIVLSKPEKIFCQPLNYSDQKNVLSFLYSVNPSLLLVNNLEYDRGLFYRLDFETSGILYYAKNEYTQMMMRKNFQKLVKAKIYLAIVNGKTKEKENLRHHLLAYGDNKSRVKVSDKGKLCECSYELLEYNAKNDVSLVKVSLKQGFRHQIRVQMQASGHPIIGDPLYGDRNADRMYLHCLQYIFSYENKHYDFKDESCDLGDYFFHFDC